MSAQSNDGFQPALAELPEGWRHVKLRDIAKIVMGQAPPGTCCNKIGEGTPFVKAGEFRESRPIIHEWTTQPLRMAEETDVLVCVVGATCGKLNLGVNAAIGRSVAAIRPLNPEHQQLIYLQLLPRVFELRKASTGTAQGVLQREQLLDLDFTLPPLPEQRRIVARLEALTARSRRARALLAEVPKQLAQARQSLLASAFRGNLTADWRSKAPVAQSGHDLLSKLNSLHEGSPAKKGNAAQATEGVHELDSATLPSTWAIADLRTLCRPDRPICYGILMPGPELKEGVPYVRVADFPKDRIRLETVRNTSPEIDAKFARSRLSTGDILLSIRGTVGRLAVVPPELEGGNITQDTARLSIHPSVSSEFVLLMLRSPDTLLRMQSAVKGVAVRGINIGDVRPLQIPLPSLPEQHEIVRRLSAAFARLDAAAAAHAATVSELDRLDQSLLARAFSGAL